MGQSWFLIGNKNNNSKNLHPKVDNTMTHPLYLLTGRPASLEVARRFYEANLNKMYGLKIFIYRLRILRNKYTISYHTSSGICILALNKRVFMKIIFFIIYLMMFFSSILSYFSFQPVLHDWCNKGRGMCYPVCGMVHIKEPLLLIDKSSLCGGSGFPFSLSEWSLTICLTPYNRR